MKTLQVTLIILAMIGLTLSPLLQHQASAAMEDKMMHDHRMMMKHISMRGDLTTPSGDRPFGGNILGNYMVKTKENTVRIIVKVDSKAMMMEDKMMNSEMKSKVLEGWLVDMQSGYKLSIGELNGNTLVFTQRIVNPWIYDLIVITEEPMNDTDPNPDTPIAGAQLKEPFGK